MPKTKELESIQRDLERHQDDLRALLSALHPGADLSEFDQSQLENLFELDRASLTTEQRQAHGGRRDDDRTQSRQSHDLNELELALAENRADNRDQLRKEEVIHQDLALLMDAKSEEQARLQGLVLPKLRKEIEERDSTHVYEVYSYHFDGDKVTFMPKTIPAGARGAGLAPKNRSRGGTGLVAFTRSQAENFGFIEAIFGSNGTVNLTSKKVI